MEDAVIQFADAISKLPCPERVEMVRIMAIRLMELNGGSDEERIYRALHEAVVLYQQEHPS